MTVIACKDGVMVADRKHARYYPDTKETKYYASTKIFNCRSMYFAACGNLMVGNLMMDWANEGFQEYPEITIKEFKRKTARLVVVQKDLGVFLYNWGDIKPEFIGFNMCAFGTGEEYAMGAMMQGATAEEAVRIACKLDSENCGMGINKRVYCNGRV